MVKGIDSLLDTSFLSAEVEGISKELDKDLSIVGLRYTRILLRLSNDNPDKDAEWYRSEATRRTRLYFETYK